MPADLELTPVLAAALEAESRRSGRPQHEIVSEALITYLRLPRRDTGFDGGGETGEPLLVRARIPYRKVRPRISLPDGMRSLDLLGRD